MKMQPMFTFRLKSHLSPYSLVGHYPQTPYAPSRNTLAMSTPPTAIPSAVTPSKDDILKLTSLPSPLMTTPSASKTSTSV